MEKQHVGRQAAAEKEEHSMDSRIQAPKAGMGASSSPPPFQLTASSSLDDNIEVKRGEVSPDVIQRVNVPVGYDGDPNEMMFAGPGDSLSTRGVGNCIVVVAYDTGGRGAVMRHIDTNPLGRDGADPDSVSGRLPLVFARGPFDGLKRAIDGELGRNVRGANIRYKISAGGIWTDIDDQDPVWKSRENLIKTLIAVFGVEPERGGTTASYDVDTNALGA